MSTTPANNNAVLTWILGIGLLAASGYGLYEFNVASEADNARIAIQMKADSLMIMKNTLEGEIETLNAKLESEIAENAKTTEALTKAIEEAKSKSRAYYGYKKTNRKQLDELQAQKDAEIAALNTQLEELNLLKASMEQELTKIPLLEGEVSNLKGEVASWEQKYSSLEKDFKDLNVKHAKLIFDAPGDNFKVEVLDNKDKLTSKAKKAKYIKVSFLMPSYLQKEMDGDETLYLSLFDEQIAPVAGWTKEVSIQSPDKSIPIQVHATKSVNYRKNPQTVEFLVKVNEKMKPGTYTGKVYSKDDYLGTVDFKLRDSSIF